MTYQFLFQLEVGIGQKTFWKKCVSLFFIEKRKPFQINWLYLKIYSWNKIELEETCTKEVFLVFVHYGLLNTIPQNDFTTCVAGFDDAGTFA